MERVCKFITKHFMPIEFHLRDVSWSENSNTREIEFIISECNADKINTLEYLHIFKFGWRWSGIVFDKTRDLGEFINCLKDLVLDESYRYEEGRVTEHTFLNDCPNDLYAERFDVDRVNGSIIYRRPHINIAKQNLLIRKRIINILFELNKPVQLSDINSQLKVDSILQENGLNFLIDSKLIEQNSNDRKLRLTAKGQLYYEKQIVPATRTVFIIMSCNVEYSQNKEFYKAEVENAGLIPYFQEEEEPSQQIILEIYDQLKRSAFVIADLSGGSENCLYELGYAHALGKRVIVARNKDESKDKESKKISLPFDLNQFRHSFWFDDWDSENNIKFKNEITDRIQKTKEAIFEGQFNIDV